MGHAIPLLLMAFLATAAFAAGVSGPKSIQLTVYNQDFALVKDTRTVTLKAGVDSIDVEDVASRIDPTSVLFKSLTAPNSVVILEQNYRYDLISPENMLAKSVGKKVVFTRFDDQGRPHTQTGTLLATNGGIVIQSDTGELVLNPTGQVSLQNMPTGLYPKPTLNWMLRSDTDGKQDAEISYLTEGIGWKADYVALVNVHDTALDLTGWVTLNNQSGATYTDAALTLMAGDVRRIQPFDLDNSIALKAGEVDMMRFGDEPQFQEKSFFEYHVYSMARPTTIRDKETKQLSLLNASDAPVVKELIYDGKRGWGNAGTESGSRGTGYSTSTYHKVNVILVLNNSKENHMGMPLPKGKIRVYKLDDDGSQQFIGEDEIDHTPKDEKIRLYIGDAFDVVGDYKLAAYRKLKNGKEEDFEVTIRNHKDVAVPVSVVDHAWSDWRVTKSSHKWTKKDAQTIEFPINVPKDGEVTVTYTIKTTW